MEKQEYVDFLNSVHPFDELDEIILEEIVEHIDILYFPLDEVILDKNSNLEYLYIIIKGVVYEKNDDEIVDTYTKYDTFSAISLIENRVKNSFIVSQEVICYGLKKEKFLELFHSNENFESYFFQNISSKLNRLIEKKHNQRLSNFMISKINEIYLHAPITIESNVSIYDTVLKMKLENLATILVNHNNNIGIVTDSNIRNGVVLDNISTKDSIEKITSFSLITINEDEFLFNALLKMIENSIKRLVVLNKDKKIIGVLEQVDLLSYFSNHSQIIISQIHKAKNIQELKEASNSVINIIKALEAKGVKIRYIAKLLSQINSKIFYKLYHLIFDTNFIENSALITMGSEGRGEQIVRTDQDMGIIIRDNFNYSKYIEYFQKYTQTLIDFGYPKCDGNIMVSNKFWSKSESNYKDTIHNWIYYPNPNSIIEISTFADSKFVCGDKKIFNNTIDYFFESVKSNKNFLIEFSKVSLIFETPLNIFTNFIINKNSQKLDIKKGGIFPIVQGVKALAIENGIRVTSSVERLKELNNLNIIDREMTRELIESYELLLKLRLKNRLNSLDKGLEITNSVVPSKMSKLEQDLLKDSLKSVNSFKKFITYHFKLDYV